MMKNQYFGDINDYTKYGLLRCLAEAGLRIGVCWMLTPNDGRPDGRKIQYLSSGNRWRGHDPDLFDDLAKAVRRSRNVRHVQNSRVLPNTSFCSALVPETQPWRHRWLTRALTKLAGADLIFFDPDNGIEVQSTPHGKKGSSKYLYWTEIEKAWTQNKSLLIFQHFPRQNHEQYALARAQELGKQMVGGRVDALITSNVLYLLAYRKPHHDRIELALGYVSERWSSHV